MTTLNETLHKEIQYLIDELSDPERDDAGVELLTESCFALLPEVTSVNISEYLKLKNAWEAASDLKQDLQDGLADLLLRYAETLAEATLQELERESAKGAIDKEAVQDCLDTLDLLTDDSGILTPWFVALDIEQELRFRSHDELLGDNDDYAHLVERFEGYREADQTTNHLDDSELPSLLPAPKAKTSLVKGFISSFLKAGKKSA